MTQGAKRSGGARTFPCPVTAQLQCVLWHLGGFNQCNLGLSALANQKALEMDGCDFDDAIFLTVKMLSGATIPSASAAACWGPNTQSIRRGRNDCTQPSRAASCGLPQRTKASECYHSFLNQGQGIFKASCFSKQKTNSFFLFLFFVVVWGFFKRRKTAKRGPRTALCLAQTLFSERVNTTEPRPG